MNNKAQFIRRKGRFLGVLLVFFTVLLVASVTAQSRPSISVHDEQWSIIIDPSTLSAESQIPDGAVLPISLGIPNLGLATHLMAKMDAASWDLPSSSLHVTVRMTKGRFFFKIVSDKAQNFTWPVIAPTKEMRGIILSRGEGFYIPVHSQRWQDFATRQSPFNTMADLTMPLWGIDYGSQSLTYVLTNPIDNSLSFEQKQDGLEIRLTHKFLANYNEKSMD